MSYTKILRWVLLIGLGLVFFVPFIIADGRLIPNMFFPFITGKNFAFRILIEALLGVYVVLALREPKYRPKVSWAMWTACAFVVWMGFATAISVDPIKSFWSNFERMEGYITVLHLFVYFVIVGAVVTAEEWWERLFQISIFSSALMGVYALLQLLHVLAISSQSGARVDTTFGNAAYLGVFMLFNVFITLFMLVRQRKIVLAQALYGIALVLQVTTLYYTQTRGALLGLVGGLIVAAIYTAVRGKAKEWKKLRQISLWGLGALVVLAVAFFALRSSSFVQHSQTLSRVASISLSDPTTAARFSIWHMALKGFVERPITGWGQENFSFVFNKNYEPWMYTQEQWFDRAHNQFLDWLIAGGIPAFTLYVLFFVLIAMAIITTEALTVPEQAVLLGLLAGYAFNNLFVFDDLISSIYFFTLLAFAHGLTQRKLHGKLFLSKPVHDHGVAIVAPLVLVATIFGVWVLNAPGLARAQNLLNAIITQVSNGQGGAAPKDPAINLAQFKTALGMGVWPGTGMGYQETAEQLMQFSSSQASSGSVDPSTRKDTHDLAEAAGKSILAERPHDARLELFLGAFYDAFGQSQNAIQYLSGALADSPQKQQIRFELGVVYINTGNAKGAVPILKAAFDEDPNYKDARILYAAGLMYAGDQTSADQLLVSGPKDQGFGTVYVDDSRILQVYSGTKQYDRVIGIWKARVQSNPNDAQTHGGLAGAYFTSGDVADAIAELHTVSKLDPSLDPQVQATIKQIQSGALKPGQ